MAAEKRQHEEWNAIMVPAAGTAKMADCGVFEKPAVNPFTIEAHRDTQSCQLAYSVYLCGGKSLISVRAAFALVGFFQVFPGFVQSALRGVSGLDGLAIFIHGALTLAGGIEDLAQHNVAPNLSPARIAVTIERFAKLIRGRLIIALREENIGDAVVGQRTILVYVQGFVQFRKRFREIALCCKLLSAADSDAHAQIAGIFEHPVIGIEHQAARLAKRVNGKSGIGANDFNALHLSLAVSINF